MKKPGRGIDPDNKVVATNRQARRDFDILDSWETGIMLQGSEVKSLRESKVQLSDAYARLVASELWLIGLHVSPYSHAASQGSHVVDRDRKLLVHRHEIDEMRSRLEQERLTLVPLSLYFKNGKCKVEVGLGRGRKEYDKRQVIATREAERETRRALRTTGSNLDDVIVDFVWVERANGEMRGKNAADRLDGGDEPVGEAALARLRHQPVHHPVPGVFSHQPRCV